MQIVIVIMHALISIHALLAESDRRHRGNDRCPVHFYPRSPCGERPVNIQCPTAKNNFYPRSPCGERRPLFFSCWLLAYFYPRSPCGERHITITTICTAWKFLSTLSLRRATGRGNTMNIDVTISIHALLAESDDAEYLRL